MLAYFIPSGLTAACLALALFCMPGRRWVRIVAGLLLVWCVAFALPGGANVLLQALEGEPQNSLDNTRAAPGDVVVVLGSGAMRDSAGRPKGRLDQAGWERIEGGLALRQRTGGLLVVTGGPRDARPDQSVAGRMAELARQQGVPSERICMVSDSANTFEDLSLAGRCLLPDSRIWLVTSAAHMPRALAVARRLGWNVQPHAVDYRQSIAEGWRLWVPHPLAGERYRSALHEILGVILYRYRGWIA